MRLHNVSRGVQHTLADSVLQICPELQFGRGALGQLQVKCLGRPSSKEEPGGQSLIEPEFGFLERRVSIVPFATCEGRSSAPAKPGKEPRHLAGVVYFGRMTSS